MKRTAINAQVFLASTATLAITATCALAALTILFAIILAHQPWLIRFAAIGLSLLVLAHGWLTLRLLWSGTKSSDIGRLAIAVFGIFLVALGAGATVWSVHLGLTTQDWEGYGLLQGVLIALQGAISIVAAFPRAHHPQLT